MSNATEFTKRLITMFPAATDDDARLCWDLTRAYDDSVHAAAMDEHRLEQGGKVWRPDPRGLAAICRRLAPGEATAPARSESPVARRTAAYLAAERQTDAAAAAYVAHVDAVIARLDDDELARHKAAVIVDANDFMKVFLAKRSPRESHQLKVLIVQRIERTGSVAA